MRTAAQLTESLAGWKERVAELEAQAAPLQKDLARAQKKAQERSQALVAAQSEAARLLSEYRAECRKLACGEDSEALSLKGQLQHAEAKVEGLKQLLADDQQEVAKAEGSLAEPNTALASARESETEASVELGVAISTEAVGEKLRSLMAETESAVGGIPSVGLDKRYRGVVDLQRARLLRLREQVRMAVFQYF